MRPLYQILDKLHQKQIYFLFQHQPQIKTGTSYFTLAVHDRVQDTHYFDAHNIDDIEKALIMMWGAVLSEVSKPMPMPLPPGVVR